MSGVKQDCAGRVSDGRAGLFPCQTRGTLEEGGKFWCHGHAPSKIAERRDKADKKWAEKWAVIDAAELQAKNKIWNDAIEAAAEIAACGFPPRSDAAIAVEAAIRQLKK